MGAETGRAIAAITALRDGRVRRVNWPAVKLRGVLQHGVGALVEPLAVDLDVRVVVRRRFASGRLQKWTRRGRGSRNEDRRGGEDGRRGDGRCRLGGRGAGGWRGGGGRRPGRGGGGARGRGGGGGRGGGT